MYDGDAPLAERRAGALTLDRDLLRELLGQEELRELLDPDALADLELSLQALADERQATTVDEVHDLLRRLGDLVDRRGRGPDRGRRDGRRPRGWPSWPPAGARSGRGSPARSAGSRSRTSPATATASGSRRRSACPAAFLAPVSGALDGLLARWARTHGPFLTPEPARRWGLPVGVVEDALERLLAAGTILRGEFRPGGAEREWCDPEVLRLLRRRSLARLRREVEPVDPAALARFLPDWQGVAPVGRADTPFRGSAALERLAEVVDQLAGVPIPASVLERDVLPARIPGYQPRLLDELGALGEVAWVGRGSLGRDDGRIVLVRPGPRGAAAGRVRPTASSGRPSARHDAIREHLARRGASFYRELHRGGRRRSGPRGARRAVGPGLGRRGHQRHVRAAAGAALEAARGAAAPDGARPGRLTALGPPEAAGRWSLRAEARRPRRRPSGSTPRALALLERHGVLTREAVAAEGVDGGFSAVYPVLRAMEEAGPDPARLLRRRPGRGAVRAARARSTGCARSASRRIRPTRGAIHLLAAADPANPYGAALAWPRRGEDDRRPLQRAAGAYVVLVDGARGALPGARRLDAPDAARRPTTRRWRVAAARALAGARRRRPAPRARRPQGRRRGRRRSRRSASACSRPGSSPGYRGLVLRDAGGPMPEGDTLFRTAAGLRPYLVGRAVTAAATGGPGRSRRSHRDRRAARSTRSRRSARTS